MVGMNTPDRNAAPEWAQYVAMDESGDWFWYEKKPSIPTGHSRWNHFGRGRVLWAGCNDVGFMHTLTERPKNVIESMQPQENDK